MTLKLFVSMLNFQVLRCPVCTQYASFYVAINHPIIPACNMFPSLSVFQLRALSNGESTLAFAITQRAQACLLVLRTLALGGYHLPRLKY